MTRSKKKFHTPEEKVDILKKHLGEERDEIHGLIICREADDALRYALIPTSNIQLRLYEVEFHLQEP